MQRRHFTIRTLAAATAAAAGIAAAGWPRAARAQAAWPSRPVRYVVPFAPGGPADIIARAVAHKLSERWGQAVTVENKPGANTLIAAAEVARAAPDGYTLLQAVNSTLTLNPFIYTKLPYDPARDFTPLSQLAAMPLVLVVNESVAATTLPELVALAKARPGALALGGGDLTIRLTAERFSREAGVRFTFVPYKSGVDVTRGMMSGEIQATISGPGTYLSLAKSGKVRILATLSAGRAVLLPEIPALSEFGLRNAEAGLWHALLAPANLPRAVQERIEQDLRAVLALPDVRETLAKAGIEATGDGAEALQRLIQREGAAVGPLARELGLKAD